MGRVGRIAAGLAILWGVVLAVASAVAIPQARAAQHLMDGARPLVQPDYLAREQALVAEGKQAGAQLFSTGFPRLAGRLGETPEALQAEIASRYPDIATGIARLPRILTTTGVALGNLQRHHQDFVDADSFPVPGVSRLAGSVAGIVLGVLLVLLGVAALRTASASPLAAVLLITAAGAVLPLAFSLPHKADGVRTMVGSLNLTRQTAAATRQSFVIVQRFHDQLEQQLIPDAAARAGTTPQALADDITGGLDALRAFRRHYPTTVATFEPDVVLRESAVDDFPRVRDTPVVALTWTFIAASAVVAVACAVALLTQGRRAAQVRPR